MTWTPETSAFGNVNGYALQFASNDDGSVIVCVGSASQAVNNAATILRSTDGGATWAAASSTPSFDSGFQLQPYGALVWDTDNQLFVWTCAYQTAAGFRIATSPDGDAWTQRQSLPAGIAFIAAAAMRAPSLGLTTVSVRTVTFNARYLLTSPDDVTWTAQSLPAWTTPRAAAWSEPLGVGVMSADNTMYKTTNGITFSAITLPAGIDGGGWVIWSDTHSAFFAIGSNADFFAVVLKSVDGTTWTVVRTQSNFDPLYTIAEISGGRLLTGGGAGTVLGSAGGMLSDDGGASWNPSPFIPGYGLMYAIHSTAADVNLLGDQPQDSDHLTAIWTGQPIRNARRFVGPVPPNWKILVADLDGTGITEYSRLATKRYVETVLNKPLKAGGQAASDNPQVYIPFPEGTSDPYLAEGTRLMWWFRKESWTAPYYVPRAATLCQLVEDDAKEDNADSSFIGWDPWHYMFSRPILNEDGTRPGPDGLTFTSTQASVIAGTLLLRTITYDGHAYIDAGAVYGGTGFYATTGAQMEEEPGMLIDEIVFPQGTTVGQAWTTLTDMGFCDITMNPVYDPFNRPNYLVEMNCVAQAGIENNTAIFGWDMMPRNVIALNRQEDGSARANNVEYAAGQGGSVGVAPVQTDADSVAKYGSYWTQQFFPQIPSVDGVTALAETVLQLRKDGKTTLTFTPEPTRKPQPWIDYNLGDVCPIWARAERFRKALSRT